MRRLFLKIVVVICNKHILCLNLNYITLKINNKKEIHKCEKMLWGEMRRNGQNI